MAHNFLCEKEENLSAKKAKVKGGQGRAVADEQ